MAIKVGTKVEVCQETQLLFDPESEYLSRIELPPGLIGTVSEVHRATATVEIPFVLSQINQDSSISLSSVGPRLIVRAFISKKSLKEVK